MLETIDHAVTDDRAPGGDVHPRDPAGAAAGECAQRRAAAQAHRRRVDSAAKSDAAIVITGQPGCFPAGLDVPRLLALDRDGLTAVFVDLWRAQRAIAHSRRCPVIFGITGHCPAGGTVLADPRRLPRDGAAASSARSQRSAGGPVSRAADPRRVQAAGGRSRGAVAHARRVDRSGDGVAHRIGRRALRRGAGGRRARSKWRASSARCRAKRCCDARAGARAISSSCSAIRVTRCCRNASSARWRAEMWFVAGDAGASAAGVREESSCRQAATVFAGRLTRPLDSNTLMAPVPPSTRRADVNASTGAGLAQDHVHRGLEHRARAAPSPLPLPWMMRTQRRLCASASARNSRNAALASSTRKPCRSQTSSTRYSPRLSLRRRRPARRAAERDLVAGIGDLAVARSLQAFDQHQGAIGGREARARPAACAWPRGTRARALDRLHVAHGLAKQHPLSGSVRLPLKLPPR